ncbi:MAG TPA: GNAT family N-acetyltransferase [Chloroflexota bacterium]|nr:GNAT family N-acetyltransferase [Chloroflexota bacterium]HUM70737.1 GNAT family N-acetyltransferase [Chloroflexota bacterium]
MSRRIPLLETERVIIRELTMDDLEAINNILNNSFGSETPLSECQRWLQWTVLGYEMFAMLEQPHYGERAVVSKETGEIIGAVGIVPYLDTFNRVAAFNRAPSTSATAEIGLFWVIAPTHQRKGFASEAARALVEYLFTREKLGRIIATTGYENLASQKVMQKLGMTIQHLEEPQPPDQFVVGVLVNNVL